MGSTDYLLREGNHLSLRVLRHHQWLRADGHVIVYSRSRSQRDGDLVECEKYCATSRLCVSECDAVNSAR